MSTFQRVKQKAGTYSENTVSLFKAHCRIKTFIFKTVQWNKSHILGGIPIVVWPHSQ